MAVKSPIRCGGRNAARPGSYTNRAPGIGACRSCKRTRGGLEPAPCACLSRLARHTLEGQEKVGVDCEGGLFGCAQTHADDHVAGKTGNTDRVGTQGVVHWEVAPGFVGRLLLGEDGESPSGPPDFDGLSGDFAAILVQHVDKDRVPTARLRFILPTRRDQGSFSRWQGIDPLIDQAPAQNKRRVNG